jgi:phosphate starvation-inducible PhoH-like protein
MPEASLDLSTNDEAQLLFGPNDRTLRALRDRLGVEIVLRDLRLVVSGERREDALRLLRELLVEVRGGGEVSGARLEALFEAKPVESNGGDAGEPRAIEGVKLRTPGQRQYAKLMRDHPVTFSVGPAGTGKTFLAVVMAVRALKAGEVQKIVLCRPAVEAGERLGYLPGDFQAKVNPYMRPLHDALGALIDYDTMKRYQEREVVEVAPLAYMRGRTLAHSFIILDEAQNTTKAQMKMFLTRMGEGSRIVVTGDVTQIDLPRGTTSGLIHAQSILRGVPGVAFCTLTTKDVVRHPVVARIIEAYEGGKP